MIFKFFVRVSSMCRRKRHFSEILISVKIKTLVRMKWVLQKTDLICKLFKVPKGTYVYILLGKRQMSQSWIWRFHVVEKINFVRFYTMFLDTKPSRSYKWFYYHKIFMLQVDVLFKMIALKWNWPIPFHVWVFSSDFLWVKPVSAC